MSMQRIDNNYGSFLQLLGLKHMIEELGHNVVFVDFKVGYPLSSRQWINRFPWRQLKKILRPVVATAKYLPETPYIHSAYEEVGLDETPHYRTKVDVLVIGSDEVFNIIQSNPAVGFSLELLGAHNNAKKVVSYAASCGNLTIKKIEFYQKTRTIAKYMSRIENISVRDENTFQVVRTLTNKIPKVHLDPVLVSNILNYVKPSPVAMSDYIILYGYPDRFNEEEGMAIRDFARKMKKKLISMGAKYDFCDEYLCCSPLEIFSYFEKADYIITDTFHGTIFSVITHRPFATIIRYSEQFGYGNEKKLKDLLERLDLKDRELTDYSNLESLLTRSIDYTSIDDLLTNERNRSIEYLRECLEI